MLKSRERRAVAKVLWWEQRPDGILQENTDLAIRWDLSSRQRRYDEHLDLLHACRHNAVKSSSRSHISLTCPGTRQCQATKQSRGKTLTLPTQGLTSHGEDHTTNSTLKPVKSRSHWNRLLNGYRARVTVEGTWPTLLAVAMTSGYSPDQRAGVWPKAHEPWAQIIKQLKNCFISRTQHTPAIPCSKSPGITAMLSACVPRCPSPVNFHVCV